MIPHLPLGKVLYQKSKLSKITIIIQEVHSMKKLFILLSIFLFSFSFSESTYKLVVPKELKMSTTEVAQNNSKIENLFSETFSTDTYSVANIRKAFGISETAGTKEEEILISNASAFLQSYLGATKYTINEISYIDADTASVTITVISPDIDKYASANEAALMKRAEQYFKEFSGKTVQQVDKDTANQDKYVPVLMASFLRSISDNMTNIKDFTTDKSVVDVHKKNGVWVLDEKIIDKLIYSTLF